MQVRNTIMTWNINYTVHEMERKCQASFFVSYHLHPRSQLAQTEEE